MTDYNDAPSHAVVCFWDHVTFSACVVMQGITRSELAQLITMTARHEQQTPGRTAAIFASMAFEVAETMALSNVAPAASTGGILARMTSPGNAPGGLGFILIDLERVEILVYGGAGWDDEGKYNQFIVRTLRPSDLEPFLPKKFMGTALEAQQLKNKLMKGMVDEVTRVDDAVIPEITEASLDEPDFNVAVEGNETTQTMSQEEIEKAATVQDDRGGRPGVGPFPTARPGATDADLEEAMNPAPKKKSGKKKGS